MAKKKKPSSAQASSSSETGGGPTKKPLLAFAGLGAVASVAAAVFLRRPAAFPLAAAGAACPAALVEVSRDDVAAAAAAVDGRARLRCPFVVRGWVDEAAWLGEKAWERVRRAPRGRPIKYDALDGDGAHVFTYWDNNTLLASAALERNVARSHAVRVAPSGRALVNAVRAAGTRYGGTGHGVSPALGNDLSGARWTAAAAAFLAEAGATPRSPGLWAGAPSSRSFPHFDSFSNVYAVLAGAKTLDLAPPAEAPRFAIHPATHPRARQARVDAFSEVARGRLAGAHSVALGAGDAAFIPPGWLHRFTVTAGGPALAVSTTALPPEFTHFDSWVRDRPRTAPFLRDTSRPWTHPRLVAVLGAFAPALAEALGASRVLAEFLAAYGPETRAELGMPPARSRFIPDCPPIDAADAALAAASAAAVAAEFTAAYRPELVPLYLAPFLENVLSRVAAGARGAALWADVLDFVDRCLVPGFEERAAG